MNRANRLSQRSAGIRRRATLAAAAGGCLALAALLVPTGARAAPEGSLDSMSLELGPDGVSAGITVQSSNGTSWTDLKEANVKLAGSVEIELKHGRVKAGSADAPMRSRSSQGPTRTIR